MFAGKHERFKRQIGPDLTERSTTAITKKTKKDTVQLQETSAQKLELTHALIGRFRETWKFYFFKNNCQMGLHHLLRENPTAIPSINCLQRKLQCICHKESREAGLNL